MSVTAFPVPVTASNLDFVLSRIPGDIVFLRFPDGGEDEVVYKRWAYEALDAAITVAKARVTYHGGAHVFTITFP